MARLTRRIRQSPAQRSHPRPLIVFLDRHYPQAGALQLPAAGREPAQSTNSPTTSSIRSTTGRVQPVHQQRTRNPQPSVPAVSHAIEASPSKTPEISQSPQQDPRSRTTLRLPGRKLRSTILPVGRAHQTYQNTHRPEALPVPHLHAFLQPIGSPNNPHPDPHRRETLLLRHLRPQICPVRRKEASRQGSPEAADKEGKEQPRQQQ